MHNLEYTLRMCFTSDIIPVEGVNGRFSSTASDLTSDSVTEGVWLTSQYTYPHRFLSILPLGEGERSRVKSNN